MDWQPIETAPMGKTVIMASKQGAVATGRWWGGERADFGGYAWFPSDELTHWMPLPEPPSGK